MTIGGGGRRGARVPHYVGDDDGAGERARLRPHQRHAHRGDRRLIMASTSSGSTFSPPSIDDAAAHGRRRHSGRWCRSNTSLVPTKRSASGSVALFGLDTHVAGARRTDAQRAVCDFQLDVAREPLPAAAGLGKSVTSIANFESERRPRLMHRYVRCSPAERLGRDRRARPERRSRPRAGT